jgi:hypothetical protein
MSNLRCTRWMFFIFTSGCVLMGACDPQDAEIRPVIDHKSSVEARLRCSRQSSDAERQLRESMKSVPKPVAVIVTRRNHEQICLKEAACLGIGEAGLGSHLQECLDNAERRD